MRTILLVLVVSTALPIAVLAQRPDRARSVPWSRVYESGWTYAGLHVASNAAYAAARAALRGADGRGVLHALAGGAVGGAVTHAGMRAVGALDEAPVIGIQVVALGASVTRNAAAGRRLDSDLTLNLPPVVLRVWRDGGRWRILPRLVVHQAIALACVGLGSEGLRLDPRLSVRAGHGVFRAKSRNLRDVEVGCRGALSSSRGWAWAGTTVHAGLDRRGATWRRTAIHEHVHAAQGVRDLVLFSEPLSDGWLGAPGDSSGFRRLARFFIGYAGSPPGLLDRGLIWVSGAEGTHRWINRLSEREAQSVAGRSVCGRGMRACRW